MQPMPLPEDSAEPATQPAGGQHTPPPRTPFTPRLPGRSDGTDDWLVSYADMATLLLTMFIALLIHASFEGPGDRAGKGGGAGAGSALQKTGPEGPRDLLEYLLQYRVNSPYGENPAVGAGASPVRQLSSEPGNTALAVLRDDDFERIRLRENTLAAITSQLNTANLASFITATAEGDGIRLNIPNAILFNLGDAELQGRGPDVLKTLAPILSAGRYVVSVEGHTDNLAISSARFPSNWELSAQRAATVVRVLATSGVDTARLQAVGYADSRPLMDNGTENGRRENRRVTIFLRLP